METLWTDVREIYISISKSRKPRNLVYKSGIKDTFTERNAWMLLGMNAPDFSVNEAYRNNIDWVSISCCQKRCAIVLLLWAVEVKTKGVCKCVFCASPLSLWLTCCPAGPLCSCVFFVVFVYLFCKFMAAKICCQCRYTNCVCVHIHFCACMCMCVCMHISSNSLSRNVAWLFRRGY